MRVGLLVMAMLVVAFLWAASSSAVEEKSRLAELDAYWAEVSRAVREGDFKAYKATCHPDGVLVAGTHDRCHPLAKALAKWKKEFDDTKAGTRKSNVTFRFSRRLGDATTAHETGIFLYEWSNDQGEGGKEYIHCEFLLLKQDGVWKNMMEYQKSKATAQQWEALKEKK
ncbi:MAG: hypothetical protein R3236_04570 [Phycisphaeraceae bacterium]|nr:hypothetical protein [Phycisphaeraceae bacterium]